MFSIDLTLKYSPIPITVQRKESADAQKVYEEVMNALKSATPQLVELTCEKDPEKKVAVFSDQISAVILSQKDGSPAGRPAGFFMQQS
ncbi:MAG: hypothetical protein GVY04_10785 [Cyanobacteria bacterium]|jgi:hypothetical protein|nr:hypothetical protein [Cyanobacteria bacterium GSL.Bin1]